MKSPLKSLLLAAALTATGMAAMAQGHEGMGGHGRMDPAKMEHMVNQRLAALKTKLNITPAQEAAWNSFTEAMKPTAAKMPPRPDRAEMEKLTLPERIEKMQAHRKEHMAAMQASMDQRDAAMKTLYAALSPEQKKIADAEHGKMMEHHAGKHGAHGDRAKP